MSEVASSGSFRVRVAAVSAVAFCVLLPLSSLASGEEVRTAPEGKSATTLSFERSERAVRILRDGKPVATYVFRDAKVLRPHFTDLHGPGGTPLTRNHPPVEGKDPTDHDTMHPGLWLAFGDLNGQDFWRNKARVEHLRFVEEPRAEGDRASFAVENRYVRSGGTAEVCREAARFTMVARPEGTLLLWRSELRSGAGELRFGSQEEMGLGVRVASPLRVKGGSGSIRSSAGGVDEAGTWGKEAGWWDYSGSAGDGHAGVLVVVLPETSRRCWGHTRDYGLLVANPTPLPDTKEKGFVVPAGEPFRLAFAVLLHETGTAGRVPGAAFDPAAAAAECLEAAKGEQAHPSPHRQGS